MSASSIILITLVLYMAGLMAIGLWASRRTHSAGDFYLGGRALGPWMMAISANASSSSAWTLVGVSGAAFAWGLSAVWLVVGVMGGMLLAWLYVAPRLQRAGGDALTLIDFLCGPRGQTGALRNRRIAAVLVLISFAFYVSAQFQAAGIAFEQSLGISSTAALLVGVAIVVGYTLLGGFLAASATDLLQGLLMAAAAIVLPLLALFAVGGPLELIDSLCAQGGNALTWTGPRSGLTAIGFVVGCATIGTGHSGQPHVLNRFMALGNPADMRRAQWIGLSWSLVVFVGMLLVGWCARLLLPIGTGQDSALFGVATQLLPPLAAGIVVAVLLSAIMSTADSQLLVAASCVTHDLPAVPKPEAALGWARLTVVAISLCALALALYAPESIFKRVLFAWHAVGSAFAPIVLIRLAGRTVRPTAITAGLLLGGLGTIMLSLFPDTPGDWLERLAPFCAAFAAVWFGSTAIRR